MSIKRLKIKEVEYNNGGMIIIITVFAGIKILIYFSQKEQPDNIF